MRDTTIAGNYAEALLELARRADDIEGWGRLIADVGGAIENDITLTRFLESPKIDAARKNALLERALQDRAPRLFLRFLQSVVNHRRQALIPHIAREYHELLDVAQGRTHARVTVATMPTRDAEGPIAKQLSRILGMEVIPHFVVNPAILGGVVVRVGDTVMDGSVRRRLATLKRRMHAEAGQS